MATLGVHETELGTVRLATYADNLGSSLATDLVPSRMGAKPVLSSSARWPLDCIDGRHGGNGRGLPTAQVVGNDRLAVDSCHIEQAERGRTGFGRNASVDRRGASGDAPGAPARS